MSNDRLDPGHIHVPKFHADRDDDDKDGRPCAGLKGDVVFLVGNPRLKMSAVRWFDQRYNLKNRRSDEGMEDMRLEDVM